MKEIAKEQNFLSVVLVSRNNEAVIEDKINRIDEVLNENFKNYEIIIVDNFSTDNTLNIVHNMPKKHTIIELARVHNTQQALRAGVELSIGDFIVEIDNIEQTDDYNIIMDLYRKSLEGNDFVFLCRRKKNIKSKIFYKILNFYFKKRIGSGIGSSIMVVSSRRGQNKTSDTGSVVVNRSLSYVLSGLQYNTQYTDVIKNRKRSTIEDLDLFVDTLIHYTDLIPKFATYLSLFFTFVSMAFLVYSFSIYFMIGTVEGWASTNTFLAFSFSGIFILLALISKYLLNLLNITKNTKQYIYKNIHK